MADNTFNFDLDAPAVPTLTLDPVEAPAAEEKQPEPAAAPEAEQVKLSPEEQAMVDAFAQKIDITNSQQRSLQHYMDVCKCTGWKVHEQVPCVLQVPDALRGSCCS